MDKHLEVLIKDVRNKVILCYTQSRRTQKTSYHLEITTQYNTEKHFIKSDEVKEYVVLLKEKNKKIKKQKMEQEEKDSEEGL